MSASERVVLVYGSSGMSIGPVTVGGIYEITERGGQDAPEKRTEEGYTYTTRVNADPVSATIRARVDASTLQQLRSLRRSTEPFPVSVKSTMLATCALDDLVILEQGEQYGAYDVQIDIREIQQAKTGTTKIVAAPSTGSKGTKAGSGGSKPDNSISDPTPSTNSPKKGNSDPVSNFFGKVERLWNKSTPDV